MKKNKKFDKIDYDEGYSASKFDDDKKRKAFIAIIVAIFVVVITSILLILFVFNKVTLTELKISNLNIIYINNEIEFDTSVKGKGSGLKGTLIDYEISNSDLVDVKYKRIRGQNAKNTLIPKETGKFILTITASNKKFDNNLKIEKEITICNQLIDAYSEERELVIKKGETFQLDIDLGADPLCFNSLIFEVENEEVISINAEGEIKALAPGKSDLFVKNLDQKLSFKITVE